MLLVVRSLVVTGSLLWVLFSTPAVAGAPGTHSAAAAAPAAKHSPATDPAGRSSVVHYAAPTSVGVTLLRRFAPPAGPYGPGHRGVDLDAGTDRRVLAAAAGTVTFAASVAGRGVVVIRHADGIRTEYEPVTPVVRAGARVVRGQRLGSVDGLHAGCPAAACLHWGARRGGLYLDPLSLLRALGPVRLLPWAPEG